MFRVFHTNLRELLVLGYNSEGKSKSGERLIMRGLWNLWDMSKQHNVRIEGYN